jgi:hypothetical protein
VTAGASGRVPPLALPSRLGSSPTPAREPGCWALNSARIPDAYEHLRADGRKSQEYLLTDHGDWQAGVHELVSEEGLEPPRYGSRRTSSAEAGMAGHAGGGAWDWR